MCRLLAPLLYLIYSPWTTIRRSMATLLTHLIFASAHTAQQADGVVPDKVDSGGSALQLPECFLYHFSFPCKVDSVCLNTSAVLDGHSSHHAQVMLSYRTLPQHEFSVTVSAVCAWKAELC